MNDRLDEIRARHASVSAVPSPDIGWLLAEVDRLRDAIRTHRARSGPLCDDSDCSLCVDRRELWAHIEDGDDNQ